MVRFLNSIAGRMVALAAVMTLITILVGFGMYRAAAYYRITVVARHLPPKAQTELDMLERTGQRGSDRYYELFERFGAGQMGTSDLGFLATIGLISIAAGGGVALILARRISRPITAVAEAAAQAAAGDRSIRVEQRNAKGETGSLVRNFNRMAEAIAAYQRERTILTAGIAHELRTPLTILKGRLHALTDGVIDPATGEAERLLRQVEHLSRLVEDLRTLANVDAGEFGVERARIDVADILRRTVTDFEVQAHARGIEIAAIYNPALVLADAVRLTQIFVNLLTNALKYAPDNSRIDVALFTTRESAVVSVIDEGDGFAAADEHRLFMPFWRGENDATTPRPGSGMGLALAAKMIATHGGRIVAKNRGDRPGAIFCAWIPLAFTVVSKDSGLADL